MSNKYKSFENSYFEILEEHTLYKNNDNIRIINYSDKSIALIGTEYSKELNDELKALKGIWSKHTKLGSCWFFKKASEEKLKKYLDSI
jgi:hypothetical protein